MSSSAERWRATSSSSARARPRPPKMPKRLHPWRPKMSKQLHVRRPKMSKWLQGSGLVRRSLCSAIPTSLPSSWCDAPPHPISDANTWRLPADVPQTLFVSTTFVSGTTAGICTLPEPLSSQLRTSKPEATRLWPWLEPFSVRTPLETC